MQTLSEIYFASSNKNKFNEAKNILSKFGMELKFLRCHLQEIQADDLQQIARSKVIRAFSLCSKPVIVEDDGLFINSLNGFPGPYSSFIFKTIGNRGILKLVSKQRTAAFQAVIAYCETNRNAKAFSAKVSGRISTKEFGRKWGFDPIFIPRGQRETYSKLKEKNTISHRYLALKRFANWYLRKTRSSGQ